MREIEDKLNMYPDVWGYYWCAPIDTYYPKGVEYGLYLAYSRAEISTRVYLKGALQEGMTAVENATDRIETFAEGYGDETESIY